MITRPFIAGDIFIAWLILGVEFALPVAVVYALSLAALAVHREPEEA